MAKIYIQQYLNGDKCRDEQHSYTEFRYFNFLDNGTILWKGLLLYIVLLHSSERGSFRFNFRVQIENGTLDRKKYFSILLNLPSFFENMKDEIFPNFN